MGGIGPEGAVVVVTGAGSGIGAATALRYADRGARVVCVDIDGAAAARVATTCGREAHPYACDVSDWDAVHALAAAVTDEVGAVDVLVNNAGVGAGGPFLAGGVEDWKWLRGVNLDGVVHGCHAFGPGMLERGRGQVVNVASAGGFAVSRRFPIYGTTKAAVIYLSRSLRADWAGRGVGVSVVCPGVVNTPIFESTRVHGMSEGEQSFIRRTFARGAAPDGVARAIVDAAKRDRGQVAVGWDAELAHHLLRFTPGPVHDLLARL